ncbi:MAG: VIT and VWA domain-containing protein [Planctomycetota bacterium]
MPTSLRTAASLPLLAALLLAPAALGAPPDEGAGLVLPGTNSSPFTIRDHAVVVEIEGNVARTEVSQTFVNRESRATDAIYRVPVPIGAGLGEMEIALGDRVLEGEVLRIDEARAIYDEERSVGRTAGLARETKARVFEFEVANVPPHGEVSTRYVTYEPFEYDSGLGRYLYPLENGGTDEGARSFWSGGTAVAQNFSFRLRLRTNWPIVDVRAPGYASELAVDREEDGTVDVSIQRSGAALDRDVVVYWRLADDLPGRMELVPYRDDEHSPGTFVLTVTPGVDLAPLDGGSDYVFVLDTSGSMEGKLGTLVSGVLEATRRLDEDDRFRVVAFSERARDVCGGLRHATRAEVARAVERVGGLVATGATNLHAGLELALDGLDADRATSLVLVTDGVANEGVVDPARLDALVRSHDFRFFGFLLGNSANWPLMRAIADATGGTYVQVSNADDVYGQIVLAASKVTHQALTDAELVIEGVRTFDTGLGHFGKVFRGEQLVVLGRYEGAGPAHVELRARVTGRDEVYACDFTFPAVDRSHPELERMWAMDRIHRLRAAQALGDEIVSRESHDAIVDLALAYQLVTEGTAMVVADDAAFAAHGVERRNRDRVDAERAASIARAAAPVRDDRIDTSAPAFPGRAPRALDSSRSGGGDLGAFGLGAAALLLLAARRRTTRADGEAR